MVFDIPFLGCKSIKIFKLIGCRNFAQKTDVTIKKSIRTVNISFGCFWGILVGVGSDFFDENKR